MMIAIATAASAAAIAMIKMVSCAISGIIVFDRICFNGLWLRGNGFPVDGWSSALRGSMDGRRFFNFLFRGELAHHRGARFQVENNPGRRRKFENLYRNRAWGIVQLAYAAKADAIVTGDADLLTLAPDSRIPILTPVAFRALSGVP